ncbi:TB2/DP1, HVA22 family-domain-containing protein [Lipomyces arxii]|uniref:TB2/DP1, HVA22 family-domain-containing protein n=1 Tax=Lipomyces arxii TaxID=56418 RepID=UPI0034CF8FDE
MFGLLLGLLSSAVSFQYPVYASYKAIKSEDRDILIPWLVYWVVVSVVTTFETWFGFLFVWLPLYQFFRFGFMLWLVLPQSQGSYFVYSTYIAPTLASHEKEIEVLIRSTQEKVKTRGYELMNATIQYIKTALFSTFISNKQSVADSATDTASLDTHLDSVC